MEQASELEAPHIPLNDDNESVARDIDLPSNNMVPHIFAANTNPANEISMETPLFENLENVVDDEMEESPLKSLFCVDYLEIMHKEMLNPECSNASSEPDVHEDELNLACKQSECNFSTADMDAYLKHEYEHIDGKSYECDVCHMKFNLFASMRNHRMSHLGNRPYKCRLCSKEFFLKDMLVEHLVKQHSKQRPYCCPFCPKRFKLRPQLKLHLSNEHSAAMLIKTCKLCGFKASSPNAFRNHFSICYMKRSCAVTESDECNLPQVHVVSSEANAIDLGTVSQKFSFVPSHYTPFAIISGEGTHSFPGPSDITQVVSLHPTSAGCSIVGKSDLEHCPAEHHGPAISPRISSLASSTTAVSPSHTNIDEGPQNLVMTNLRPLVKSEPAEVRGDDSQNGNALPTSTMDLSMGSLVETSYNSSEAACCGTSPDLPIKIKAACSSREDRLSDSCRMPMDSNSFGDHARSCCTGTRVKCNQVVRENLCHCTSSGSRSTQYPSWSKRERPLGLNGENETETACQESHKSRKRLCQDKSTSTETFARTHFQNETRHAHLDQSQVYPRTPISGEECCNDNKNHLVIKNKADTNLYTCPFCEISFPDQTLYFLHRSLHSESHPWKCNLCGKHFKDRYDFNSHIISQGHR